MKRKIESALLWTAEFGVFRLMSLVLSTLIIFWDLLYMGFRGFWEWRLGTWGIVGLILCIVLMWFDYVVDRYLGA